MPGLVPGIHAFLRAAATRGWPGGQPGRRSPRIWRRWPRLARRAECGLAATV